MKRFTKEVKIGVMAIAALVLLVVGINFFKGIHLFKPTQYVYAHFNNVEGLMTSNPIFADGFQVGIVRSLNYDFEHAGNIYVEIALDDQVKLPKGTIAEIVPEMLGGARMNLIVAPLSQGYIHSGDTLSGKRPKGMAEEASAMLPQAQQLLPKMDSVLVAMHAVLTNSSLTQSMESLASTLKQLQKTTKSLNGLMSKQIPTIADNLAQTTEQFKGISANLAQIDFAATMKKVDATLTDVKSMTNKMNSKDNNFGLLLNDRKLYDHLDATICSADSLMIDLKTHPKRYVHFSIW